MVCLVRASRSALFPPKPFLGIFPPKLTLGMFAPKPSLGMFPPKLSLGMFLPKPFLWMFPPKLSYDLTRSAAAKRHRFVVTCGRFQEASAS